VPGEQADSYLSTRPPRQPSTEPIECASPRICGPPCDDSWTVKSRRRHCDERGQRSSGCHLRFPSRNHTLATTAPGNLLLRQRFTSSVARRSEAIRHNSRANGRSIRIGHWPTAAAPGSLGGARFCLRTDPPSAVAIWARASSMAVEMTAIHRLECPGTRRNRSLVSSPVRFPCGSCQPW
jgi:hypothetical protein